ncbi:uncharacterized protein PAC_03570 [Phialocephala subalpina]|uniref:Myb-like DNA-binding domain-containing protein n=1 Tax=Phialocephala subalpina TaxID=576137 RepID=A0A1L7WLQ5_9HELO|nr:uncharacterized protein PAC_03570 [Phialocephala subalpina]
MVANIASLSGKDAAFLISVFKHMKTRPEINWDAVTAEMKFKSNKVTQTRYGQVKKKLEEAASLQPTNEGSATDANDLGTPSMSPPPAKRKRTNNSSVASRIISVKDESPSPDLAEEMSSRLNPATQGKWIKLGRRPDDGRDTEWVGEDEA